MRECRGITFDKDGKIICRKLHKFFNINEREDHKIDLFENEEFKIYEKLDGSMICPVLLDDKIEWHTKRGFSDVAKMANRFVYEKRPDLNVFARYCAERNITPVFEFYTPEHRIILDYGKNEKMTLIAIRDNVTGRYFLDNDIANCLIDSDCGLIEYVKPSFIVHNIHDIYKSVKKTTNFEGYILVRADGDRIKLKSDWYFAVHKLLNDIGSEHKIVELFYNGEYNDKIKQLKDCNMDSVVKKIEKYRKDFIRKLHQIELESLKMTTKLLQKYSSRAEIACSDEMKQLTPIKKACIYCYLDKKDIKTMINKMILKYTSKENRWQNFKQQNGIDLQW